MVAMMFALRDLAFHEVKLINDKINDAPQETPWYGLEMVVDPWAEAARAYIVFLVKFSNFICQREVFKLVRLRSLKSRCARTIWRELCLKYSPRNQVLHIYLHVQCMCILVISLSH